MYVPGFLKIWDPIALKIVFGPPGCEIVPVPVVPSPQLIEEVKSAIPPVGFASRNVMNGVPFVALSTAPSTTVNGPPLVAVRAASATVARLAGLIGPAPSLSRIVAVTT